LPIEARNKMKQTKCSRCKENDKYISPSGFMISYCSECYKIIRKNWKGYGKIYGDYPKKYDPDKYAKNREKEILRVKKYQKRTNYASEKTQSQREIRTIKRKTRRLFPLDSQMCLFCTNQAIEHHHNTIPIQYDKFIFVCHKHHIEQNKKLKGG
jgi:hypothetical protein